MIYVDLMKERIDVRSTVIYDYIGKKEEYMVLAQTSPPVRPSQVGSEVEASFLYFHRELNERRRYGYKTKILKVLRDYEIRGGMRDQAVVIEYPADGVKETSVRLHFRVEPGPDQDMSVEIGGVEGDVNLLDLSLGGLQVAYRGHETFKQYDQLNLLLKCGGQSAKLKGEVARAYEREGSKFLFIGFRFLEVDGEATRLIQQCVSAVMRAELRARSGIDNKEDQNGPRR